MTIAGMYTTLTADQKEAIMAACDDPKQEVTGMAKWNVDFVCGKKCTMLSDQCKSRQEAIYAAVERFGGKVKNVY